MQKNLCLSLFALLLLASCGGCITVPETRACAVAGVMSAGANCAYTLSGKTEELSLGEFLEFLEPTDDRGPAICQSSDDFNKMKTALEQACKKLGPRCSYELRSDIKRMGETVKTLQELSR